jgi:hypothetical protein
MLVREGETDAFLAALKAGYFDKRVKDGTLSAEDLPGALFATKPGAGAALLRLNIA